jgi:hypothetical protein
LITLKFYPNSVEDESDKSVNNIEKTEFSKTVNFGKNVIIGH